MKVIANLELKDEEADELSRVLGCNREELAGVLAPYAGAALEELVMMFLGKRVFTRGSDILEYRLYLLIEHAFGFRIPSEQDVCKLFQITSSSSRSLIRAVMSKYQYRLKEAIDETLKGCLRNAEVADDGQSITLPIHNINLVEELNRILAEIDSTLPPVQKKRRSVATYELKPSAYLSLCRHFGIEPVQVEDE